MLKATLRTGSSVKREAAHSCVGAADGCHSKFPSDDQTRRTMTYVELIGDTE